MTYRPQEYWDRTLAGKFDLRGTGEPGLSLAYNEACYTLRREVLDRALADVAFDPRGRRVLDVGCGTGYWTAYYTARGAEYTGLDIAPTSVARLSAEYPGSRFVHLDVGEAPPPGRFDLVNAFDVLYHVTDDARWERALRHLAESLDPGGVMVITDVFSDLPALAEHNRMRSLARYLGVLEPLGLARELYRPTHVLLNRHLGFWKFLNRAPGLLLAIDRAVLASGGGMDERANKLLLLRKR